MTIFLLKLSELVEKFRMIYHSNVRVAPQTGIAQNWTFLKMVLLVISLGVLKIMSV
jgi:hypothetical protein